MPPGTGAPNQGGDLPTGASGADAPRKPLSQLAKEEFGVNFHGEVQPDPTPRTTDETPTPDTTPDDPPDADVVATEAGDEGDKVETTGDDKAPDAEDQGDKGDDADTDENVSTMSELVQSLDADPNWFEGLQVDVTVNGHTSAVPFRDLVANFQMDQAADQRLEQAKITSHEAKEQLAQQSAALEAQYQTAGAVLVEAGKVLNADMEQINWEELHREDPGQFAAEKVKYQERTNQLDALKQHLLSQYQQHARQTQTDRANQHQTFLQEEYQLLQQHMPAVSPDWSDPEKGPVARARLTDYLADQGFSQEDIMGAADHRLLLIAEKARLHDEARGKLNVTKKRIRKVMKVMKPGTPPAASTRNLDAEKQLRGKLRGSGKLDDAVALLRQKRKG